MEASRFNEGLGRTRVSLSAEWIGSDLIVCLFNERGHIGAVAVSDFCEEEQRTSTSIITRLGHKDDVVARQAASTLCRHFQKPVCVIAGIHLDSITDEEIAQIIHNCAKLVENFANSAQQPDSLKENG